MRGNPMHPARRSGLLLVGFAFKVSAVPFHMWTPDAYEGAPAVVTGFMSTGVKAAAFAAFVARVPLGASSRCSADWAPVLWAIAARDDDPRHRRRRGADQPEAHARVFEHRARRLPAGRRSSRPTTSARRAILFYLLAYAVTNLGAFGVIALLGTARARQRRAARLRRPVAHAPGAGRADDGLPAVARRLPADRRVHRASGTSSAPRCSAGYYGLAIIGVLTSVVSVFFYLRVVVMMYMVGTATRRGRATSAIAGSAWPRLPSSIAAIFYLGVLPTQIARSRGTARSRRFFDRPRLRPRPESDPLPRSSSHRGLRPSTAARCVTMIAVAETDDIDREISLLEAELKTLEADTNMFFAGRLPRPPWETRTRVEGLVKRLDRTHIANYGIRSVSRRCRRGSRRSSTCGIAGCARARKDAPGPLAQHHEPVVERRSRGGTARAGSRPARRDLRRSADARWSKVHASCTTSWLRHASRRGRKPSRSTSSPSS